MTVWALIVGPPLAWLVWERWRPAYVQAADPFWAAHDAALYARHTADETTDDLAEAA